jgi:hypothetical protein
LAISARKDFHEIHSNDWLFRVFGVEPRFAGIPARVCAGLNPDEKYRARDWRASWSLFAEGRVTAECIDVAIRDEQ